MQQEYVDARIKCSLRYLEEIRSLAVKHRAMAEYISSLEEDASSIGGIDYSKVVVSTQPNIDSIPSSVALLIDMKAKAEDDAQEYFKRKAEARELLDEMGGTYGLLLMLRYCTVLPWVRVADVLNYSTDWCKHMHKDALCEFYDYLPHTYRFPMHSAI